MSVHGIPNIGDYCRVKIRHNKAGEPVAYRIVAGTVVKVLVEDFGWTQYQLDGGVWFSPRIDTILECNNERNRETGNPEAVTRDEGNRA